MAMFKMEGIFGAYPQQCVLSGQVVVTAAAPLGANTIISQATLVPSTSASGATAGSRSTLLPFSTRVAAVVNPTTAYNPKVAPNANSASVLMLDLSGFPSEIVSVQLQTKLASGTGGAINLTPSYGVLYDFDDTNKYVYAGIYNASTGALVNWGAGTTLMYTIVFADSFAP